MRQMLTVCASGALFLSGCAPTVWVRPGATESDFAHDRAVCDYQSELGTPDINTYNGSGRMGDAIGSGISDGIAQGIRKGTLMNKCMVANGWTRQRVEQPVNHGDATSRVVVGPPGNQSVLDGTGRYLGPASNAPPVEDATSDWAKGYKAGLANENCDSAGKAEDWGQACKAAVKSTASARNNS